VKEPLSAFLPDFPGNIDTTSFFTTGYESKETSTLNSLLDPKLDVVNQEIYPLNNQQLQSFRLYTGSPVGSRIYIICNYYHHLFGGFGHFLKTFCCFVILNLKVA
jgi:hypothetical protein